MTVHNLDPTLGEMELMGSLDPQLTRILDRAPELDGWRSITRDELARGVAGEFTAESIAFYSSYFGDDWEERAIYHMVGQNSDTRSARSSSQ